jgi:pyruvate carboxylase
MSYLMYPQVFLDYEKFVKLYDNTSVIPTPAFLYGLQSGDEIGVTIEEGKTLIIRYLTTGEPREDGTRTVFFELNGQPREVNVPDRYREATLHKHPKADPDDPNHVAAPMPGKVSSVAVSKGEIVKVGQRLLSIEAMKMETAVYCPRDARVKEIAVKPNSIVTAKDLLVVLEDDPAAVQSPGARMAPPTKNDAKS